MFHLIVVLCLIHFSVSDIIHGQILLNDDVNQNDPIPANSRLLIQLEQISEGGDISEIIFDEIDISKINNFPIEYQVQIPSDISPASSNKLLVQIKKGPIFLYVGEEIIPDTADPTTITINIPVRVVRGRRELKSSLTNTNRLSWSELVGLEGTLAVQYIKETTGFTNVVIIPEGSMVTMDYRLNRVRVFVDKQGLVVKTPRIG